MAFKYRGNDRTSEDVDRRAKVSGGSYDSFLNPNIPFFKAKEGDNRVRIFPRTWDDIETWGKDWSIEVWVHNNVGPDNGTYLCLDKMLNKQCPVCEVRRELDSDEADQLRLQKKFIAYVLDRSSEKTGVQFWTTPMGLYKDIQNRSRDKDANDSVIYIDNPDDGYDVSFVREGTGLKTRYTACELARKASYLTKDEKRQKELCDFVEENPLPEQLVYYDADHIEKVLSGKSERRKGDRNADEAEDTRGERASRRRGEAEEGGEREERSSRRRSEPEEQEERPRRGRDKEPEVEEGERERPSRTARRGSEAEEGDGDNGGEERAPARRRLRGGSEEEAEGGGGESPSRQARERVGRLRSRAG